MFNCQNYLALIKQRGEGEVTLGLSHLLFRKIPTSSSKALHCLTFLLGSSPNNCTKEGAAEGVQNRGEYHQSHHPMRTPSWIHSQEHIHWEIVGRNPLHKCTLLWPVFNFKWNIFF